MTIAPWIADRGTIAVVEWDTPGHVHSCSGYVEDFWLPAIGPSAVCAIRRLARIVEGKPSGVTIDLAAFSASIGLGAFVEGRNAHIRHTLSRLAAFGLCRFDDAYDVLEVRTMLPLLTTRQLERVSSFVPVDARVPA